MLALLLSEKQTWAKGVLVVPFGVFFFWRFHENITCPPQH